MNIQRNAGRCLVASALVLGLGAAHADITVYASAADFNAGVTSPGLETFFGVSLDTASASPMFRRTQLGTYYTYLATSSTSSFLGAGSADDVRLTPNVASDVVTFSGFSTAITAFGGNFFGSDFNGQYLKGDVTLTVTDSAGEVLTRTIAGADVDSFLGFTTHGASIVSVSLSSTPLDTGDSLWATADNLVLAQATAAVPEPAMGLLFAVGLAGLALSGAQRRRRHS